MDRKKGNTGYVGKGYEFNEKERNKVKDMRKELSKAYDVGADENEEEANEDA
jgi:hypothetical protein